MDAGLAGEYGAGGTTTRTPEGEMNRILALLLAAALAGCAPALSRVPFFGGGAAALAGEWEGEYAGTESGRSGSIVFRLSAAADSAWGDVVMVPRTPAVPVRPAARPDDVAVVGERAPQPLAIRFVRVDDERVQGALEPYRDPDCGCALTTTFTGRARGDVIEGTFVSRGHAETPEQHGKWRVVRRRR